MPDDHDMQRKYDRAQKTQSISPVHLNPEPEGRVISIIPTEATRIPATSTRRGLILVDERTR